MSTRLLPVVSSLIVCAGLGVGPAASAQASNPLEKPPALEPLPDVPPPPPQSAGGQVAPGEGQPQVTTRVDGGNRVEEYRVHGHLYAIRVTPKVGKPYTMVDPNGTGHFENAPDQADNPAGAPVRPPHWVLFEF